MGAATKSGNDGRIKDLQGRQERQQQLDAPVQLRELSCLRNARIFLRGYSELHCRAKEPCASRGTRLGPTLTAAVCFLCLWWVDGTLRFSLGSYE